MAHSSHYTWWPMALISMLHNWSINTDGNGATVSGGTVRTILFDYRKAFDVAMIS